MFEYQEEADELLQQIIPHLRHFSHISGGEGTVYFIDDNFVVKKFYSDKVKSEQNQQNLLNHCAEVNKLSMQGLAIPRIYAVALPTSNRPNAYLLEERAKGSSIYSSDRLENISKKMKINKTAKLQRELISEYKSNFLTTNEQLEALPDSEIEKFIMTDYYMSRDFKYGLPDVVKSNILFDGNTLTHIDSYFIKADKDSKREDLVGSNAENTVAENVLMDMAHLMCYNGHAQLQLYKACGRDAAVEELIYQNKTLIRKNLKRLVKATNRLISPKFDSPYKRIMYEYLTYEIESALNSELIMDITDLIEKEL